MHGIDEVIKAVEADIQTPERCLMKNPVVQKLARGELTREELGRWALEMYWESHEFPNTYAAAYVRCPVPEVRRFLFENIYEEETGGLMAGSIPHIELKFRFIESLGFTRGQILNSPPLPATQAYLEFRELLFTTRPWVVAVGAYAVGAENQVVEPFKLIAEGLRTHYGVSKHDAIFYDIHSVADEAHGDVGLRILHEHCRTPELQDELYRAALRVAYTYNHYYLAGLA